MSIDQRNVPVREAQLMDEHRFDEWLGCGGACALLRPNRDELTSAARSR